MTMTAVQRLGEWTNVDLIIDGAAPIHGVSFVYDGTTATARDRNGIELGTLEVAPDPADGLRKVDRLDGKTHGFTAADGTSWVVYRRGCGCGA